MTSDFEAQLHTLFDAAARDLPEAEFTTRVSVGLQAQRQRLRLLQGAAVVTTLVTLWLLAPDIAGGTTALEAVPDAVARLANRSVRQLWDSSLLNVLYLYGGAFAASVVSRVLQRSPIRWA